MNDIKYQSTEHIRVSKLYNIYVLLNGTEKYLGLYPGDSFRDACRTWLLRNTEFSAIYNEEQNTILGEPLYCKGSGGFNEL